jgi:predicted transcriptional regulator
LVTVTFFSFSPFFLRKRTAAHRANRGAIPPLAVSRRPVYPETMTLKLSAEQRDALKQHRGPLPVEDEQTREMYFLVDEETLETLRRDADRHAIREGIADMEAGRVVSLEELDARIRARLRRPLSA